jgi:hypothetical protein
MVSIYEMKFAYYCLLRRVIGQRENGVEEGKKGIG